MSFASILKEIGQQQRAKRPAAEPDNGPVQKKARLPEPVAKPVAESKSVAESTPLASAPPPTLPTALPLIVKEKEEVDSEQERVARLEIANLPFVPITTEPDKHPDVLYQSLTHTSTANNRRLYELCRGALALFFGPMHPDLLELFKGAEDRTSAECGVYQTYTILSALAYVREVRDKVRPYCAAVNFDGLLVVLVDELRCFVQGISVTAKDGHIKESVAPYPTMMKFCHHIRSVYTTSGYWPVARRPSFVAVVAV